MTIGIFEQVAACTSFFFVSFFKKMGGHFSRTEKLAVIMR